MPYADANGYRHYGIPKHPPIAAKEWSSANIISVILKCINAKMDWLLARENSSVQGKQFLGQKTAASVGR